MARGWTCGQAVPFLRGYFTITPQFSSNLLLRMLRKEDKLRDVNGGVVRNLIEDSFEDRFERLFSPSLVEGVEHGEKDRVGLSLGVGA